MLSLKGGILDRKSIFAVSLIGLLLILSFSGCTDQGTSANAEDATPKVLKIFHAGSFVITSYSIHYTNLYEYLFPRLGFNIY